jgi:hypothetical protein
MYGRPVGHKRFFFLSVVAFFLLLLLLLFSLQKFKVCFLLFKNSGKCFPSTPKFLHALQARESLTGRREMIPLSFLSVLHSSSKSHGLSVHSSFRSSPPPLHAVRSGAL